MKGDFTRGHDPDLQRAKRYRRVLLQQGRVLLDSDHAATMGAMDRNLRELGQDLGCAAGGSDYGFLVTPGKLYALFDELDHVPAKIDVKLERDYRLKYLDRYPSLRIAATAELGLVEIELLTPHAGGPLVLWCRSELATEFVVQDVPKTVSVPVVAPAGELAAVVVDLPATAKLRIVVDAGKPIWIAMIESLEDAAEPSFWLAPGRFHFGGLIFENPEFTPWPEQAFPAEFGFATAPVSDHAGEGGFLVAYIEGWERLHTHLHDRGIREEALGGLDTTVRTEALGQVKLVWAKDEPDLLALRTALARPVVGDGTLAVSVAAAIDDPDPCALPVEGGYSGPDNRLYHFEVHVGGALGQARFKWSRDNGSELYRVAAITGAIVHVASGSGLQDGDLVELISDIVELGDAAEATWDGAAFTPAIRNVGQLALLQRDGDGVDDLGRETFKLIAFDEGSPMDPDPARYPEDQRLLLRRWHGVFTSPPAVDPQVPVEVELEHGIKLELAGTRFVVGDWWEWQARVLLDNENGEFQTSPHGPERLFAPLAVFENDSDPLVLRAWADHRFVGLCDLDADRIPFDGTAFESNANTVQEALVELYDHTGFFQATNCCGLEFRPDPFSDASDDERLAQLLLDALPNGGTVCFEKGIYSFSGSVNLGDLGGGQALGGNLTIKASNDVVIVQATGNPLFLVPAGRELRLEGAVLLTGNVPDFGVEPVSQIRLYQEGAVFQARGCMFVMLREDTAVIFDGAPEVEPPAIGAALQPIIAPDNLPEFNVDVHLSDCVLLAHRGIRCGTLRRLSLDRVVISAVSVAVAAERIGQLDVRHSTLAAILQLDGGWNDVTPETVLGYRYAIADFAQDLSEANLGAGSDTSYALLVRAIDGGTMTHCRLAGGHTIFADALWHVRITDSLLRSRHDGIWVNQAEQAVFSGLDVATTGDPGTGISIHLYAHDTVIERCQIDSMHGAGIRIAMSTPQPGFDIDIVGIRIAENQVHALADGITVGSFSFLEGSPTVLDVLVSGNEVSLPQQSQSSAAIAVFAPPTVQRVLVTGNITTGGRYGIYGLGPNIGILGNHVTVFAVATGLRLITGRNSVIRDNIITATAPDADESIVGIEIVNNDRVAVDGNAVVRLPLGNQQPVCKPLDMRNCTHATISANTFESGTCRVEDSSDVEVQGNRFNRGLHMINCQDGSLLGNRVEEVFSMNGIQPAVESLLVFRARGRWRVSDNGTLGTIRVLPDLLDGLFQQEVPCTASITNNQALRVQAGYLNFVMNLPWPDVVTPFEGTVAVRDASSVMVVTGNYCFEGIIVNEYAHMVVAHNFSRYFTINLPAGVAKVEEPNATI